MAYEVEVNAYAWLIRHAGRLFVVCFLVGFVAYIGLHG